MNCLADPLPTAIDVMGESVPVETGHRRWLLALEALSDERLGGTPRAELLIRITCPAVWRRISAGEVLDGEYISALIGALTDFALFGGERGEASEPAFDFTYDGELIAASFLQAYGIDLYERELHFHKFLALLRHLPSESEFMRVVRLRQLDTTKIEDEGLRRQLRRLKASLRIKKNEKERGVEDNG